MSVYVYALFENFSYLGSMSISLDLESGKIVLTKLTAKSRIMMVIETISDIENATSWPVWSSAGIIRTRWMNEGFIQKLDIPQYIFNFRQSGWVIW